MVAGLPLSSGSDPDANLPADTGTKAVDPTAAIPVTTTAAKYLLEIEQAEKDFSRWYRRARKIVKIYTEQIRNETRTDRQYAMLWANTEVLKPAVYARPPKPTVSRRFNDQDPIGRAVAEVLERALISTFERQNIDSTMESVRDDFLLVARGTAWVRYAPKFTTQEFNVGPDDSETIDVVSDESLEFDFVNWEDFLYPKSRRWSEVPWNARKVYLDKNAFIERFGQEKWDLVGIKLQDGVADKFDSKKNVPKDKVCVYELWSRRDNEVVWLTKSSQEFLDQQPPLYDLHGFFPCPEPAWGTLATDSLIPIPDYIFYQDQAEEINTITAKIAGLQDALKLTGFYPAGAEAEVSTAIERAAAPSSSNQMIPVPGWGQFVNGGGAKELIQWWPAEMVINVLNGALSLRRQMIDDVYQITGISDILRGSTEASETATAQQIKAQWGGVRIKDKQKELARFARDLARIAAEIISEKFQPETLWRMTGLKYPTAMEKQQSQRALAVVKQQQAAPPPGVGPQPSPQPVQAGPPAGPPIAGPQPQAQLPSPPPQSAPSVPQAPPDAADKLEAILASPSQEDVLALIRDDQARSYRIDIETDSTIAADEAANQEAATKFVGVIGQLMETSLPVIQAQPALAPVIGETIKFVARQFPSGRQLEEAIDLAIDKIEQQAAAAMKAPPPPNPEIIKAQTQAQSSQADIALRQKQLEADTAERAARLQMDQQKQQHGQAIDVAKVQQDAASSQREHALAAAGHNKVLLTTAYQQADQSQTDQMRQPTAVETLAQQIEAVANQLVLSGNAVQDGQRQLGQALRIIHDDAQASTMAEQAKLDGLQATMSQLLAVISAPKKIVRGSDGRAVGVETARSLN